MEIGYPFGEGGGVIVTTVAIATGGIYVAM